MIKFQKSHTKKDGKFCFEQMTTLRELHKPTNTETENKLNFLLIRSLYNETKFSSKINEKSS